MCKIKSTSKNIHFPRDIKWNDQKLFVFYMSCIVSYVTNACLLGQQKLLSNVSFTPSPCLFGFPSETTFQEDGTPLKQRFAPDSAGQPIRWRKRIYVGVPAGKFFRFDTHVSKLAMRSFRVYTKMSVCMMGMNEFICRGFVGRSHTTTTPNPKWKNLAIQKVWKQSEDKRDRAEEWRKLHVEAKRRKEEAESSSR